MLLKYVIHIYLDLYASAWTETPTPSDPRSAKILPRVTDDTIKVERKKWCKRFYWGDGYFLVLEGRNEKISYFP